MGLGRVKTKSDLIVVPSGTALSPFRGFSSLCPLCPHPVANLVGIWRRGGYPRSPRPRRDIASRISEEKYALGEAKKRLAKQGKKLGNPNIAKATKLGAATNQENADRFAANTLPIIRQIQASGITTLRGVARALTARGVPSARGTPWSPVAVANIIRRSIEGTQ